MPRKAKPVKIGEELEMPLMDFMALAWQHIPAESLRLPCSGTVRFTVLIDHTGKNPPLLRYSVATTKDGKIVN